MKELQVSKMDFYSTRMQINIIFLCVHISAYRVITDKRWILSYLTFCIYYMINFSINYSILQLWLGVCSGESGSTNQNHFKQSLMRTSISTMGKRAWWREYSKTYPLAGCHFKQGVKRGNVGVCIKQCARNWVLNDMSSDELA